MYGRGTLDMKGGLVAGLLAIHAVHRTYGSLAGDVRFESVIEEECTGNGTLAARLRGPRVNAALIPEVTGEDVQIANPGVVWFEVKVTGKAAYVGLAGASVNAVEVAMDVVAGLRSRFGSRVNVYLPPGCAPLVLLGQRMIGGETVLADRLAVEPPRPGLAH